jgi:hypothetical protein
MSLDLKRFYSFSVRTVLNKSKHVLGHEKLQVENWQDIPDFYIKALPEYHVTLRVRVIHFQETFRLVILTAIKNFIANDNENFVPYKYEYIQELYLLFVIAQTVLEVINSS